MKTTITQNQIFRTFSRLQRSCYSAVFLLTFLLSASSSWGQIAQRGTATTAISTSSASVTVNKPTGVVAGDIMIANIGNYFNGTNTTASISGWTVIAGTDIDRGRATLLYKIAGGSEPTNYTFTVTTGSTAATGAIVAFSGVNTTTPFDVTAATSWYTATSATLSAIPSLTTTNPNAAVLMFGNCPRVTSSTNANFVNTDWTLTSPASLTELYDVGHNGANNSPCVGGAWALSPTAGATGVGGLNCNVNTTPRILGGITIALRPCVIISAGSALSAICKGSTSAALGGSTGGSATGGTWSDGAVGGSFSPNATTLNATYTPPSTYTGTVTLTLTSSGGSCGTATASKTLTVTAPNAATISYAGTPFCKSLTTGQAVTLTGTSGGTYSSTSGLTINSSTGAITPSSSTAGTYTVTYTMAATGGCSAATATTSVIINNNPTASISGTATACGSVTLTASGGTSYLWNGGSSNATASNSFTASGTYSVTVTDANGCTNSTSQVVTVNTAPAGLTAATTTSAICSGTSANLTATATGLTATTIAFQGFESSGSTVTYAASGGATKSGSSATGDRPASTSFVNTGSGSYWVTNGTATITTANITGLGSYSAKKVSLDLASFSIGSTTNGADATDLVTVAISFDGGSTYSDELTVNGGSTGNSYWSFTSGTGVATVTYDGLNNPTAFSPSGGGARTTDGYSTLEVNLPDNATQVRIRVTLLNNSASEGWVIDDITLSGVPTSFAWTSSPTGFTSSVQNPTGVSPSATTTYTVTATNSYGCTATASTTVTVRPVFTSGTISSTRETICSGGTPTVIGSTTDSSGGDNSITYSWRSSADSYAAAISGATSSTYTPPAGLTTTTSYRRYAKDATCNTTATVSTGTWTVTVRPVFTSGTISSTGQTICSGGTPSVIGSTTDSSGGDNSITYSWRSSADSYAAAISGATSSTYTPPAGLTTTTGYRRYAKDATCNTTATVSTGTWTVTVNPNVTPTFTQVSAICSGASLSALPTTSNNSITGAWSPALNNTATTTYTFTPSAGQCASTATMTITVNALPTVLATASSTVCSGTSVTLSGSGATSYSWNNGISNAVAFTPSVTTTYTVTGTAANGCTNTATSTVTVNSIPTTTGATICAGGSGSLSVTSSCADLTGQTAGANSPSTATTTGSGTAWNNPTRVTANDNSNATVSLTAGGSGTSTSSSQSLNATGFGFSLPSNALITGITASIGRYTSGFIFVGDIKDAGVYLIKAGAATGTNLAVTGTAWPTSETAATYGSSTSLWGTTWTASDINASNFGFSISTTQSVSTWSTITANIDYVNLTVTYTIPGTLQWYTVSSGGTSIGTGSTFNPVGVTNSGLANTNTAGTTSYYVACSTAAGACRAKADFVINAVPNSPTAVSYNCSGDAVLTATAGTGETVAWYTSNSQSAALASNQTYSSNTATLTIASPSAGSYYAFATNANGCMSANGTQTPVEVTAKNTYTGTNSDWFTAGNWSCGSVPTASTNVVIPTGKAVSISYTPGNGPAEAGTVTLEGTAALTVTTDHDLTVTGKVTVASGANFTVQNNASLKQIDNIANSGEIKVNRSTRALKLYDGVLWSSPVAGQVVNSLASGMNPNYIKYYNITANTWNVLTTASTSTFPKGTAYLMRTPSTGFNLNAATPWNVTFTGVPNNGDIEVTGPSGITPSSEQYYLVGNPYPSAIDMNKFMDSNPNVTGVFYFFRKTDNSPYSAYGVLTKTETAQGSGTYNNTFNLNHPTEGAINPADVIPVGQGFFVTMKTGVTGKVFFNNGMRIVNNHGSFNRIQTNTEDKFKLNLTTTSNAANFSQMNLGYAEGSSSSYDVGYDAESFNDGRTNLSSMIASTPYSIQSRGNYSATDFVPLYFKTNVSGEHRIKLQDAQGVFAADQMVCIKDNVTGTLHNLTANGDYVFTATAGTFTNRFEVVYQQAYYTALQSVSCGSTLANMSSLVYADVIEGASGYRFKVVNNTTSAVQTIDRQYHWFALNMLPSYDYNTAYSISVQVQKDGVWVGYYGTPCSVNSPNIASTGIMQINPSQCGVTLPTLGYVIATTPVAGATGYKFRITNTTAGASGANLVQEITRTNHWFTLAMLARYNYGSSYAIEVAVKTTGGYTAYGNACTVYSPAVPTLVSCGQAVATATTLVRTTAMTMATQYRFQVTRMATQETITFDTANYWFSFRVNVPGYAAGEQYGVRIAVMTAGTWSPYGDACDLTAPSASARTTEEAAPSEANLFKPVAYPNPFTSTFGISLATPSADVVNIIVYDLQGRLIEKQNVFVSQLDSLQIGTNYPSGDYLLVVAQGANIKTSHIHKD